jgi:hypothetical protein
MGATTVHGYNARVRLVPTPSIMNRRLTLISGFPGCGKSTFAKWLAEHKKYFHADMERGGLDIDGLRLVWNDFVSGVDRESFIDQVFSRSSKVVIDWNFPPNEISLNVIAALRGRGCEIWWFEGYRLARTPTLY